LPSVRGDLLATLGRRTLTNKVTIAFTSVQNEADLIQRREPLAAPTIRMVSGRESFSAGEVARVRHEAH
jgi:hypothetical protein